MRKPFRKLAEPIRRWWWKERLARISAPIEHQTLKAWIKSRKSYLYNVELSKGRAVEIKVGEKIIKLRGADKFKWQYQKRKYIRKKIRPKITEISEILTKKFQHLPQTNNPLNSLASLFVECIKHNGKFEFHSNPDGPNVKFTIQGKTLTLEYTFHMGLEKARKETRKIELNPQDLNLGREVGKLDQKAIDISFDKVDQATFKEIQSMK